MHLHSMMKVWLSISIVWWKREHISIVLWKCDNAQYSNCMLNVYIVHMYIVCRKCDRTFPLYAEGMATCMLKMWLHLHCVENVIEHFQCMFESETTHCHCMLKVWLHISIVWWKWDDTLSLYAESVTGHFHCMMDACTLYNDESGYVYASSQGESVDADRMVEICAHYMPIAYTHCIMKVWIHICPTCLNTHVHCKIRVWIPVSIVWWLSFFFFF